MKKTLDILDAITTYAFVGVGALFVIMGLFVW